MNRRSTDQRISLKRLLTRKMIFIVAAPAPAVLAGGFVVIYAVTDLLIDIGRSFIG